MGDTISRLAKLSTSTRPHSRRRSVRTDTLPSRFGSTSFRTEVTQALSVLEAVDCPPSLVFFIGMGEVLALFFLTIAEKQPAPSALHRCGQFVKSHLCVALFAVCMWHAEAHSGRPSR